VVETYHMESIEDWVEFSFENRWTDGLPVLPPTEAAVERMLSCVSADRSDVVCVVPPAQGEATYEKIAVNCVMAGCRPEYLPVVVAALQAMTEPSFNLHGIQCTHHNVQPLTVVSGPLVETLEFNTSYGFFGGGSRANGTIGRALRLILVNIGGGHTGNPDRSSSAHPGRYSFCIAENSPESPWAPLHVRRGVGTETDSAVTVFGSEAPQWVAYGLICPPVQNLWLISQALSNVTYNSAHHAQGEILVIISPGVMEGLTRDGWSEAKIQDYLFRHSGNTVADVLVSPFYERDVEFTEAGWEKAGVDKSDLGAHVPVVSDPSSFMLMIAGGSGAPLICKGWGQFGGWAATRLIEPI
jgi:hypothetical protein